MQVDGVEQNGGGSMDIHLVKKKVYVKARVWEEEGFLILKKCFIIVSLSIERQTGHECKADAGDLGTLFSAMSLVK